MFFAIRSERNDGHKYIADLYRRGVRSFVVEVLPADWQNDYPDANFLKVPLRLRPFSALPNATETSLTFRWWASPEATARPL